MVVYRSAAVLAILGAAPLSACSHGSGGPGDAGTDASDAAPDHAPVCGIGYFGDPSNPIVMQPIALAADGTSSPIGDGSTLALLFPPQGGRVIFVGVRATNIDPCGVKIGGFLRDPVSNFVRPDIRTINLEPVDGGWGASSDLDISSFANVPVCPNEWSSTDAYGNPYELTVSVTDADGRMASQTMTVTLACAEPSHAAECMCICMHGYVLGQSCGDGGDDAPPDAPGDAGDGGVG